MVKKALSRRAIAVILFAGILNFVLLGGVIWQTQQLQTGTAAETDTVSSAAAQQETAATQQKEQAVTAAKLQKLTSALENITAHTEKLLLAAAAETAAKRQAAQQPLNAEAAAVSDPASYTAVINKRRPLPAGYRPADLVQPEGIININGQPLRAAAAKAATALYRDVLAATGEGFAICSGFRSYEYQTEVYNNLVAAYGQAAADLESARPGYSEHQTGLAMDIVAEDSGCRFDNHFAITPAGKWVNDNAHKYGFILRYPPGKRDIVGYITEEWHWRYVGIETATAMHNSSVLTLEEFFGTGAAPDYN